MSCTINDESFSTSLCQKEWKCKAFKNQLKSQSVWWQKKMFVGQSCLVAVAVSFDVMVGSCWIFNRFIYDLMRQ